MSASSFRSSEELKFSDLGSPVHYWLIYQAAATAIIIAWFAGGETKTAPIVFVTLASTTVIPVVRLHLLGHEIRWRWFIPFALTALFLSISWLNPSHSYDPISGNWLTRAEWLRFLPTTMDKPSTLAEAPELLATLLLGGSLAAVNLPQRYVRLLWLTLLINALILSLIGATIKFSGSPLFLGFKETKLSYFFSSFTYRNHWSAYAVLMTAVSAGFLFSSWRSLAPSTRQTEITRFFAICTLLILFTPILAGSRSGTVLMGFLGLIILGGALKPIVAGPKRSKHRLFWNLAAILAILGSVAALSWPTLAKRFQGGGEGRSLWVEATSNLRIKFTEDTLKMAAKRPLFGWGLGSYVHVFPKFQGDYLRDENGRIKTTVNKAHNDWAQTTAELGFTGLLVLALPIGLLLVSGWRAADQLGRWGLIGILLIGIYAFLDFPMRNLGVVAHGVIVLTTAGRLRREKI